MNARDLKGLAVVTLSDAEKVGHIDDVLFDAQYRQVLGFRVKHGAFGGTESVLRRDVSAIGQDAITVPRRAALNEENRFPELVGASTLGQVEGTHVVTEGGTRLGAIHAVQLDDDSRNVLAYALDRSFLERLRGDQPMLNAQHVQRIGERGIMIVANAALPTEAETEQSAQPQEPAMNAAQSTDGGQPARSDDAARPPSVAANQPGMGMPPTEPRPGIGADTPRGGVAPVPPTEPSRQPAQAGPLNQPPQPGLPNQPQQPGQLRQAPPPPGLMQPGIANPTPPTEPRTRSGLGGQPQPPEREQPQPPTGA